MGKAKREKIRVILVPKGYGHEQIEAYPYAQKRVTHDEREAMVALAGMKQYFVADDFDCIKERLGLYEYLRRDFANLKRLMCKCFFELLSTIPDDQMKQIARTCADSRVEIGRRMVAGGQKRANDDFGLFISYSELNALLDAAKQQCMLCERDRHEEKSCALKKTFDELCCTADHSRGCEYRYKWNEVLK